MQIQQIEYIIEVAKTGSISEAALNLHVSAATISQSLSNFEKEYDISLFKRSRLGTQPTEQGKRIIEIAYKIQELVNDIDLEAKSHNQNFDQELKIIGSPTTLATILPKAISIFNKDYPNTELKIEENQNVITEMRKNEYDLGFILVGEKLWQQAVDLNSNLLHFNTLFQGRMYVCVNKDSSLAFKETVTLEDLKHQKFIMHRITKPIYMDMVAQLIEPKILFETNNTETIKKAIAEGIGISCLSEFNLTDDERIKSGQIIAIPLINYEKSNLTCGYIRPKKRYFSKSARSFLKIINSMNS